MKKTYFTLVLLSALAAFLLQGCGKKKSETGKDPRFKQSVEQVSENKPDYLLENLSLSGLRVNDTTNNIKANILLPTARTKDLGYSLKPVSKVANERFKDFVQRAKAEGKISGKFHTFDIKTVFVNSVGGLISCLLEVKEQLVGKQNSVYRFGVTYRKTKDEPLAFTQVFPLDEKLLSEFVSTLGWNDASITLSDLEACEFAIGRDSLFVFLSDKTDAKQRNLSAALDNVQGFMVNGR